MRKAFFREYLTVKQLEADVKAIVNPKNLTEVFTSDLISDLIYERHPCLSGLSLRPEKFRKWYPPEGRGNYEFQADFGEPINWHPCSWRKCLVKSRDPEAMIRRLLKKIAREYIANKNRGLLHEGCFWCQNEADVVHHEPPPFSKILSEWWGILGEEKIADMLEGYYADCFEDSNVSFEVEIASFISFHDARCTLIPVCETCHKEIHRKERTDARKN